MLPSPLSCSFMANGTRLCNDAYPQPLGQRETFMTTSTLPSVPLDAIPASRNGTCYPESQTYPLGKEDQGYMVVKYAPTRARADTGSCPWRSAIYFSGWKLPNQYVLTRDEMFSSYADLTIAPWTYFDLTLYLLDNKAAVYRTTRLKFYTHNKKVTMNIPNEYSMFQQTPQSVHAMVFSKINMEKRQMYRSDGKTRNYDARSGVPSDWIVISNFAGLLKAVANEAIARGFA